MKSLVDEEAEHNVIVQVVCALGVLCLTLYLNYAFQNSRFAQKSTDNISFGICQYVLGCQSLEQY
eukprot:UN02295